MAAITLKTNVVTGAPSATLATAQSNFQTAYSAITPEPNGTISILQSGLNTFMDTTVPASPVITFQPWAFVQYSS